jgi:hypothetical protein
MNGSETTSALREHQAASIARRFAIAPHLAEIIAGLAFMEASK